MQENIFANGINNNDNKEFKWDDELIKEMIYSKLPVPDHYVANVQKCLNEFKELKSKEAYKKLDYEILSYTGFSGGAIPAENSLVHLYDYPIYSVKRLSDNEVFSIGDNIVAFVLTTPEEGTIEKFTIYEGQLKILFSNPRKRIETVLSVIEKPKRTVLFTTNGDGKEIFEGNRCWFVDKDFKIDFYDFNYYSGNRPKEDLEHFPDIYKYFSTEYKAKEYVLMNKPSLSLNDIINTSIADKSKIAVNDHFLKLKELAQKKINNNV